MKMLERVAKAILEAQANVPFYVIIRFKNKYDVMEMMPPLCADYCHLSLSMQDKAEDECERLNSLWAARKAVEALKLNDDAWQDKDLSSHYVDSFNYVLNVILKDE